MGSVDIQLSGLIAIFLLLIFPILISYFYRLGMIKKTIWSIGRMTVQLFAVGFFLEYIFQLNNPLLNLSWLLLMILTAIFSALSSSKIRFKFLFFPTLISFGLPTVLVLLYFNHFVIQLSSLFEARYLIALGGMLLGNVLSINIVAINSFYQEIRSQKKFYLYRLAMGATESEALAPFFRKSFQLALLPALAKTATIGIVSLPGMMSGQILGGSSPATAIRYQIAIMIAIYVAGVLSVLLSLILSSKNSFNEYSVLKEEIFKKKK